LFDSFVHPFHVTNESLLGRIFPFAEVKVEKASPNIPLAANKSMKGIAKRRPAEPLVASEHPVKLTDLVARL
jgi:hypothetical protein